ncbi:MAG: hypothetical protein WDW38_001325 [Sanguina aurantia]
MSLGEVKVSVLAPDSSTVFNTQGNFPAVLLAGTEIPAKHSIEVLLSVWEQSAEVKPQQLFLMLTTPSGLTAYAVAKPRKEGGFALTMSAALLEKQIGRQVGGRGGSKRASSPEAISYSLGTVDFALAGSAGSSGAGIVKTASSQTVSNTKPEIVHQHRLPSARPPTTISLVFTGLVLLPLIGVVLVVLTVVKTNFKAFPTDPVAVACAFAFHGSVAGVLVLYLLFWLRLNLAETLPLALVGGAVIALTGYHLLSRLANARLAEAKEGGKTKKE